MANAQNKIEITANGRTMTATLDALDSWIREIGAASDISSLGVTPDMLDRIADSTIILTSGYKTLDHAEIVDILRNSL